MHITDEVLKCEQDLFQLLVLLQPCIFKDLTSHHCETFGFCLSTQPCSCIKTYPTTHPQLALKDWILHTFSSAKDCNQHTWVVPHTKTSISLHIKKNSLPFQIFHFLATKKPSKHRSFAARSLLFQLSLMHWLPATCLQLRLSYHF